MVYLAINRPYITARLNGLSFIVLLLSLMSGVTLAGAVGAAWAVTITSAIDLVVDFVIVFKALEIAPQRIFRALVRPFAGALIMLLGLIPLRLLLPVTESWIGSMLELPVFAASGSLLYVSSVFALWHLAGRPKSAERQILSGLNEALQRLSMKVTKSGSIATIASTRWRGLSKATPPAA